MKMQRMPANVMKWMLITVGSEGTEIQFFETKAQAEQAARDLEDEDEFDEAYVVEAHAQNRRA